MTKEELEKEAKVFATYYESLLPNEFETFYKAFLKVAEPREKRIAELETQIEKMKEMPYSVVKECANETLRNENERLETQIEKMKSDVFSLIKDRMNDDIDQNIIERLAEKWEIKENDRSKTY